MIKLGLLRLYPSTCDSFAAILGKKEAVLFRRRSTNCKSSLWQTVSSKISQKDHHNLKKPKETCHSTYQSKQNIQGENFEPIEGEFQKWREKFKLDNRSKSLLFSTKSVKFLQLMAKIFSKLLIRTNHLREVEKMGYKKIFTCTSIGLWGD